MAACESCGRSVSEEPASLSKLPAAAVSQVAIYRDVNRLLCSVSSHLWIVDSKSELVQLEDMMESLVRGGAQSFLPAIVKGCWAASACRSDRHVDEKVLLFSKLLRLGKDFLTPDDLHEGLRIASMACACVWGETSEGPKSPAAFTQHSPQDATANTLASLETSTSKTDLGETVGEAGGHGDAFGEESCVSSEEGVSQQSGNRSIRALLEICRELIEAGASNLNKVLRDIISYKIGNLEVLRTFLQARGSERVDVEKALRHATACGSPVDIIAVLIREGGARELSRPLMLASINGALPAVELFVKSGCKTPQALYGALYCATVAGQTAIIDYFLSTLPSSMGHEDLRALLRTAASDENAVQGIVHLLRSNFLADMEATLHAAEDVALLGTTRPEVREVLLQDWSHRAFQEGRMAGEDHHLLMVWVLRRSDPGLPITDLPLEVQAAMAYLPIFKECRQSPGKLLTERQRGELVEAVSRLYAGDATVCEEELVTAGKNRLLRWVGQRLPGGGKGWGEVGCRVRSVQKCSNELQGAAKARANLLLAWS